MIFMGTLPGLARQAPHSRRPVRFRAVRSPWPLREWEPFHHLLVYKKASVKGHLIPDRLERWGLAAGIQPMTPHRLRHTLTTMLINQGMPIVSLQKFLGHQDINKTMIYARVYDNTVKEQFSRAMSQIERIAIINWPHQMIELVTATEQPFDSV